MSIQLRVISLGAGVQSTTMALMAAHGEITPMPDCAIFADTGSEPKAVYDHLQWLIGANVLPFPVHVVTAGNLRDEILAKRKNARPPFYVANRDGSTGILRRQCTQDYKIYPIEKKVRGLLGIKYRGRWPKSEVVEQWIGISTDEAMRMKPSRRSAITMRWPLIERRMSRHDCLRWLERNEYPTPPKSACTFCPFHSDIAWRHLRDTDPIGWQEAVQVDAAIRKGIDGANMRGEMFVHASLLPLDQVDLSTLEDHGQLNLFNNECEGMCGV